jgi:hypothetical protein
MTIKSLLFRVDWLLLLFFALSFTFLFMSHLSFFLMSLSNFFKFLGLDDDMVEGERLYLSIVYIRISCIAVATERSHTGYNHQEDPSIPKMRCHLFYLNLVEFANPLV